MKKISKKQESYNGFMVKCGSGYSFEIPLTKHSIRYIFTDGYFVAENKERGTILGGLYNADDMTIFLPEETTQLTLSHECLHATFDIWQRINLDWKPPQCGDEMFVRLHECLVGIGIRAYEKRFCKKI